jgi:hypothetical protein
MGLSMVIECRRDLLVGSACRLPFLEVDVSGGGDAVIKTLSSGSQHLTTMVETTTDIFDSYTLLPLKH